MRPVSFGCRKALEKPWSDQPAWFGKMLGCVIPDEIASSRWFLSVTVRKSHLAYAETKKLLELFPCVEPPR